MVPELGVFGKRSFRVQYIRYTSYTPACAHAAHTTHQMSTHEETDVLEKTDEFADCVASEILAVSS